MNTQLNSYCCVLSCGVDVEMFGEFNLKRKRGKERRKGGRGERGGGIIGRANK